MTRTTKTNKTDAGNGLKAIYRVSNVLRSPSPDPERSPMETEAQDPWEYISALDDELLKGGVILSEWCSEIVRQCDLAFVGGAYLGTILTAVSGAETYLRSEYSETKQQRLFALIDNAPIAEDLRADLHRLRRYRNRWVHVEEPWADETLLESPEFVANELEEMARFAVRVLRQTIYENQWI